MDNQDDEIDVSEDEYDDILDDNFDDFAEEEEELGGLDLLEDEVDEEDEFLDEDEDWGLDEPDENDGLGAQKEKKTIDLSFNAMAIIGALIVGVGVLIFQVVTTESDITIDTFTSALQMSGASDGPVFGETNIETVEIEQQDETKNDGTQGFLHDPESLNSMKSELKDSPPMPTPISQEKPAEESEPVVQKEERLTPLEEIKKIDSTVEIPSVQSEIQIPRPPDDVATIQKPLPKKEPVVESKKDSNKSPSPKAADFLKATVEARAEKMKEKKPEPKKSLVPEKPETVKKVEKVVVEEKPIPVPEKTKIIEMVDAKPIEKLEMPPKQETAVSSDVEKKLDMIVSRLEDMELQIAQIREGGESKIDNMSEKLAGLEKEMAQIGTVATSMKSKTVTKKEPVKKAAPKKAAPKKAPTPKKAVVKKKSASATWELRAAQPGKAWVAKGGQNNMQPVVVGDSLAGIGRVTSISFNGSRWVVVGTSGQIAQK